jgi:hypothetical protein
MRLARCGRGAVPFLDRAIVIRAYFYVTLSAVIWFAEGFLLSRFLAFSIPQTVLLAAFYTAALAVAVVGLRRAMAKERQTVEGLSHWRAMSVAPMATTIVGSFLSLPLVLVVLALGKL